MSTSELCVLLCSSPNLIATEVESLCMWRSSFMAQLHIIALMPSWLPCTVVISVFHCVTSNDLGDGCSLLSGWWRLAQRALSAQQHVAAAAA